MTDIEFDENKVFEEMLNKREVQTLLDERKALLGQMDNLRRSVVGLEEARDRRKRELEIAELELVNRQESLKVAERVIQEELEVDGLKDRDWVEVYEKDALKDSLLRLRKAIVGKGVSHIKKAGKI